MNPPADYIQYSTRFFFLYFFRSFFFKISALLCQLLAGGLTPWDWCWHVHIQLDQYTNKGTWNGSFLALKTGVIIRNLWKRCASIYSNFHARFTEWNDKRWKREWYKFCVNLYMERRAFVRMESLCSLERNSRALSENKCSISLQSITIDFRLYHCFHLFHVMWLSFVFKMMERRGE